jgi:hypothetical protein
MNDRYAFRRALPRRALPRGATLDTSLLDRALANFHHRWETDALYRARISAVGGAATLLFLCGLAATISLVANAAFGGAGSAGGSPQTALNGSGAASGLPTFPTGSVPPWTPGTTPNGAPAPNSQTPPPSATKQPTTTPGGFDTPTPGGTLPTTCNGSSGRNTWALTPCPQLAGQSGTLTISAPNHPGASLNIVLSFGVCANNQNCTLLFTPDKYSLNASSTATITYTVPAAAANNTAPISGMIQVSGGPTLSILAAPVQ